jgi:DNA-binding GntR family transcriptional regulator
VVNSAISALSTKGYLRVVPRHYIVVADFLVSGSLTILEDIYHSDNERLKREMVLQTLACRMMVEKDAIRKTTQRTDLDLRSVKSIIDKETKWRNSPNRNVSDLCSLDLAFHNALIRLADNMVFALIYHTFDYLARQMVEAFFGNLEIVDFVLNQHNEIYKALASRDGERALMLIEALLQHGENELLKII